ncbi:MAG: 3-keto-5-aminohexanoate cleavage protein [Gemmatimonadetes bacterium]|nr:3-keto-5-aminohexanoate cleavage protein [Gemmatimonadota bacterium]
MQPLSQNPNGAGPHSGAGQSGSQAHPVPHPYTPYPELVINFCPTGMIPTKEMTPHVPISPAEVVDDACLAIEIGAAIVHLHARDSDGKPTWRGEIYEEMILGIRSHHPEAVVCVSCSGRNFPDFERRSEVLDLTGAARPDLASLTLTSLDFPTGTSLNAPDMVEALAARMAERGVKPELECFDFGMVSAANLLIRRGLVAPPFYFNLLLGSRYSVPATARHLSNLVADLPDGAVWSAAGIGLFQLPMNVLAIAMGGHCRTGLEDNIHAGIERGVLGTNAGAMARLVRLTETFGRPVAGPARARQLLGLGPAPRAADTPRTPGGSAVEGTPPGAEAACGGAPA